MMMNLFSSFDPSTSLMLSLNWFIVVYFIFIIPLMYWVIPSKYVMFWMIILDFMYKEFMIILFKDKNMVLFFCTMMIMVMVINFMGLFPYIFTSSSHMVMSLTLSLSFWLTFMIYSWVNYSENMFIHLVPYGTPGMLMVFMVIIESISLVIRPMTLAIRLTANMIAGHLLLILVGSLGDKGFLYFLMMLVIQMILMILEMSVSLIQSYVFSILSSLYSSEYE
uniref:ATP synthase subunit a n=1 Tax=Mellinus arvensis TaxID=1507147 RepID=A0A7L7S0Z8_9HYME|nr:ATP synthase F0 subunit 6 [Mellinus arvensis]